MLLIPTYIAPSKIEGVGVFAEEDIPAGTLIWQLDPKLDRLIHESELGSLSPMFQKFAERYGYPYPHDPSQLIVELDNGRFMNHSDYPNTVFSDPDVGFTIRDIAAGEEILCNYAEFDPSFEMLPGRQFLSAAE
jgi:uncharacterized protein